MIAPEAWLLAYCAAHLAAHFGAFVLWFRHRASATSEHAIFLFHLVSAFMLTTVAGATVFLRPGEAAIAAALAGVFAHGIYSLTFLELWTLAQISYSREVLQRIHERNFDERAIADLAAVGEAKRVLRLRGLFEKGLVRHENGLWSLTTKGRIAGRLLSVLLWVPAVRSPG